MSPRPLNRLLLTALAVGLCGLPASSALALSPAVPKTYVAANCDGAAFKPTKIVLTCGDAGLIATKLQWSQWGNGQAYATGTGEEKICKPNCAEGRVGKGPMQVTLSAPKVCSQDGKRHFTKVRYVWPNGAPGEGPKQGTIPLPCALISD